MPLSRNVDIHHGKGLHDNIWLLIYCLPQSSALVSNNSFRFATDIAGFTIKSNNSWKDRNYRTVTYCWHTPSVWESRGWNTLSGKSKIKMQYYFKEIHWHLHIMVFLKHNSFISNHTTIDQCTPRYITPVTSCHPTVCHHVSYTILILKICRHRLAIWQLLDGRVRNLWSAAWIHLDSCEKIYENLLILLNSVCMQNNTSGESLREWILGFSPNF